MLLSASRAAADDAPAVGQRALHVSAGGSKYALVSRLLALLLLSAALLKIAAPKMDPMPGVGSFSNPVTLGWVSELEIVLGLWLLWGRYPWAAWVAATGTFILFADVSFRLGWSGQASCGCFGALPVNPWYAFAIDCAALVALAVARPNLTIQSRGPRAHLRAGAKALGVVLLGTVTLLIPLAAFAVWQFDSVEALLASLRNQRVSTIPGIVDIGSWDSEEQAHGTVELANWTDRSIRVVGATSDCSCVLTRSLPITIPQRGRASISLDCNYRGQLGNFTRTAWIMTDDPGQRFVTLQIVGRFNESGQ